MSNKFKVAMQDKAHQFSSYLPSSLINWSWSILKVITLHLYRFKRIKFGSNQRVVRNIHLKVKFFFLRFFWETWVTNRKEEFWVINFSLGKRWLLWAKKSTLSFKFSQTKEWVCISLSQKGLCVSLFDWLQTLFLFLPSYPWQKNVNWHIY